MIDALRFDTRYPDGGRIDLKSTFESEPTPHLIGRKATQAPCEVCNYPTYWHEFGIDGQIPLCGFLCANNLHGAPEAKWDSETGVLTLTTVLGNKEPVRIRILSPNTDEEWTVTWEGMHIVPSESLTQFQILVRYANEILSALTGKKHTP